jgi:hypothetical protein
VREVSASSKEQSKGIKQIGAAVTQMDQVVQSNAANAEETAAASEQLSAQSQSLSGVANHLSALVTGQSTEPVRPLLSAPDKEKKPSLLHSLTTPNVFVPKDGGETVHLVN